MKKILISFLLLTLIIPNIINAQTSCNIEADLNNLISIKDDLKLSAKQKAIKEFEARKTLLSSVITCSLDEIKIIKQSLKEIDNLKYKEKEIRDSFNKQLDEFEKYYQENESILEDIKDNNENLKELATTILSTRENEYNQKITAIVDFTFSFKQQTAIDTASDRLSKITTSLEKILSLKDKEVNRLLEDSSQKINKAIKLKNEAHSLIIAKYDASQVKPEEIATTTIEAIIEKIEEDIITKDNKTNLTTVKEEEVKEPRTLIRESLQNIKDTYANFFKISRRVKTLLGI